MAIVHYQTLQLWNSNQKHEHGVVQKYEHGVVQKYEYVIIITIIIMIKLLC